MAVSFSYRRGGSNPPPKTPDKPKNNVMQAVGSFVGRTFGRLDNAMREGDARRAKSYTNPQTIQLNQIGPAYRQTMQRTNNALINAAGAYDRTFRGAVNVLGTAANQFGQGYSAGRVGVYNQDADDHLRQLAAPYIRRQNQQQAMSDRYTAQADAYRAAGYPIRNEMPMFQPGSMSDRAKDAYAARYDQQAQWWYSLPPEVTGLTGDDAGGGYPDYWGGGGWGWGGGGGGGGGGYTKDKYYNDLMMWSINKPTGA